MMAVRDDVTVRIDTELRAKARELEINLSRLLEGSLREEIERLQAVAETLSDTQTYDVAVEDRDNNVYTGRITGRLIAASGDVTVYLTEDDRVLAHDRFRLKYWEANDPEEDLRESLEPGAYSDAMQALGRKPVIDL